MVEIRKMTSPKWKSCKAINFKFAESTFTQQTPLRLQQLLKVQVQSNGK